MLVNKKIIVTTSLFVVLIFGVLSGFSQTKTRGATVKPKTATTETTQPPTNNPNTAVKPTPTPPKPKKKIIVVLDFDDASLNSDAQKRPMGRQIAILLSNEFSNRGNFTVIERSSIDRVIEDQNRSYNGRYDQNLASKVGKVLSASTVVLGTITEYSTKKKTVGIGGIIGRQTYSAKIGLAIRLVDVNTGEVLDSVTVQGFADEKSMATSVYGQSTELTEDLKTALFSNAANQAIAKGVDQLEKLIDKSAVNTNTAVVNNSGNTSNQNSPEPTDQTSGGNSLNQTKTEESKEKGGLLSKMNPFGKKDKNKSSNNSKASENIKSTENSPVPVPSPSTVQAKVVNVSDGKVYLKNTFSGIKVGSQLIVYKITKTIKDDAGDILGTETAEIARIEVLEVQEKLIICKILSGGAIQKDDLIRLPK